MNRLIKRALQVQWQTVAISAVLILAFVLRIHGIDWDDGHYLHPDERFIATVSSQRVDFPEINDIGEIFDPAHSPINPRRDGKDGNAESYAYGTLPIYVQGTVSWLLDAFGGDGFGTYERLYLVGRTLTAVVDVLTAFLVFVIGRRLFGSVAGLIAASLYAFLVLPIQLSHFFTSDPWLTLFVTATIYFTLRYVERPTVRAALLIGTGIGCAFATKASVPSLLVPVIVAFGYVYWNSEDRVRVVEHAALGALASVAVFCVFEPYAIVRFDAFWADIDLQSRIVRGTYDVPYTRQFIGLTPGVYELKNLFYFTAGPAFTIMAIVSAVWAARRAIQLRSPALSIPLLWIPSYIPILLFTEARFLRYTLPLLPVLAILIGGAIWTLSTNLRWRTVAQLAGVVVVAGTAIWGVGFSTIYGSTHPRIHASEWIYEHIEPGSRISYESWDDPLPLSLDAQSSSSYQIQSMDIYGDRPPEEKVRQLYDDLQQVDYVVLSSDRVRESIDNEPWRYAVQGEYYRRLLAGQLGYQLVYESTLFPNLFGIRWDDSQADESFTVYDHPTVRIFKRVESLDFEDFRARLLWGIEQPWEQSRYSSQTWLRLSQPVDTVETSTDASYNSMLVDHPWAALVAWVVIIEVIGLAVLPLAAWIFRRSPDRGALSTRLIGLLLLGWLTWIGPRLSLWKTSPWAGLFWLSVLGGISWWIYRSRGKSEQWRLPSGRAWRSSAAVYGVVFGVFLLFRALYPDFWQTFLGGEKPFELAYMRAVAESAHYPPIDPWFAGGTINYYYYGWHLIATITRLIGIGTSNAFQFSIPLIAGLLASQTAGAAIAITGVKRTRQSVQRIVLPAGLAIALVVFMGNLDPIRQIIDLRAQVADLFDFWAPTRVIPFTINEFPFFSLLWFDVHPHVLNFPILMLLVGVVSTIIRGSREERYLPLPDGFRFDWITLAVLSVTLGTILVTNVWDMPLSLGLTVAGLTYAGALHHWRGALVGLAAGLVTCILALLWFAPFHTKFYRVVSSLGTTTDGSPIGSFLIVWGILVGIVLIALLVTAIQSNASEFSREDALLFGALFVVSATMGCAVQFARGDQLDSRSIFFAGLGGVVAIVASIGIARPQRLHAVLLSVVTLAVLTSGLIVSFLPAAGLSLAICLAAGMMTTVEFRRPRWALPWGLVAIAFAIIAGVEVIYIVDDLNTLPWFRMNTVFKFYLQAWLLLALGSGILLSRLWRTDFSALGERWPGRRHVLMALILVATILPVLGFSYMVMGTPARLSQDMDSSPTGLSLDGYAWMNGGWLDNATGQRIYFTGDLAAIEWLDEHADPTDVIVEGSIGPYRGNGSRISSATGLPAVLGWDRHQYQQRYPTDIGRRMAMIHAFYNNTDPAAKLDFLRRHRVRWIVVGDVERWWNTPTNVLPYSSPEGLSTFDAMTGNSLRLAFEAAGTKIYEVVPFPALQPDPNASHKL